MIKEGMGRRFSNAVVKKDFSEQLKEPTFAYEGGPAEFAGEEINDEEDCFVRELMRPSVSEVDSKKNFEAGLEKAREIISNLKGDLIGAQFETTYQGGWDRVDIMLSTEYGFDNIMKTLAQGGNWSPLYDDTLASRGGSNGDSDRRSHFIGGKEIYSYYFSRNSCGETFYFVDQKPVTYNDYYDFVNEIRRMLYENYQQRGAVETYHRQLPSEAKAIVEKIRFDSRNEQVLKDGKVVQAGNIYFKHGPYGASHFGSGGGYGSVNAYDLAEWRKGNRVKKNVTTKNGDNGFTSGPTSANIEDNTIIICKGGDCIGYNGRSWEEIYICE